MQADIFFDMSFKIVGGLGLFLLGMDFLEEGFQALALSKMRLWLARFTGNRITACLTGTAVTGVIQSSTVMTVMVIGFVNSGLLNLEQAIGLIMGANIGTTLTTIFIALPIGKMGLPMLGLAALAYLFTTNEKFRYSMKVLMGFGMIFFGLELIIAGFTPVRSVPELMHMLSLLSGHSLLGILLCVIVAAVMTAIIHSSSATIGIVMGLGAAGVLDYVTALALTLGADIGTTVTALLAALKLSVNAKRTAYAHVSFNVIGVLCMLPLFPLYVAYLPSLMGVDPGQAVTTNGVEHFPYVPLAIATFSTGFNVFNTLLLLPFSGTMAWWLTRLIPNQEGEEDIALPHHIFHQALTDPDLALQLTEQEQLRYLRYIPRYFELARRLGANSRTAVTQLRSAFDSLGREIDAFLSELLSKELKGDQARHATRVLEQQYLLTGLQHGLHDFIRQLGMLTEAPRLSLTSNFIEALDTLVLTAVDALAEEDQDLITSLVQMTSASGRIMQRIHQDYLEEDLHLSLEEKSHLLALMHGFERLILQIHQLARLQVSERRQAENSTVSALEVSTA